MPTKPCDELWQHFFYLLLCLVRPRHRYQRAHRRRRSRRRSAGTQLCRHTHSRPHGWCRIGSSRTLQSHTRPALQGRGSLFSPWTRSELLPQFCSAATALFSTCLSMSSSPFTHIKHCLNPDNVCLLLSPTAANILHVQGEASFFLEVLGAMRWFTKQTTTRSHQPTHTIYLSVIYI